MRFFDVDVALLNLMPLHNILSFFGVFYFMQFNDDDSFAVFLYFLDDFFCFHPLASDLAAFPAHANGKWYEKRKVWRHKPCIFHSQAQGVNRTSLFHTLTRSRFPFSWCCSIPNAKISGAMVDGHRSISNKSTKKKSRTQQQTRRRKKWCSQTRNPLHDLCCKKCVTFFCRCLNFAHVKW